MKNTNSGLSISKLKNLFPQNLTAAFSADRTNYDYRAGSPDQVLKNRKDLFISLGLELNKSIFPQQVHKAHVRKVSEQDIGRGAFSFEQGISQTDALITDAKGVALCMLSADCLPIIFYESSGKAIGITHAGWKGIQQGIIEKTIKAMITEFSIDPKNLKAFFCPAIGSCCYEVGPEFSDIFPEDIILRDNIRYLDIKDLARKKCLDCAMLPGSMNDASVCTKCSNDRFFSFRAGDKLLRMISLVAINS